MKINQNQLINPSQGGRDIVSTYIRFVFLISIILISLLAILATPVSDDYCFAYGTRKYGFLNNFRYFVSSWSPSLSYLWLSLPWELNLTLVQVSSIFCIVTLIISGVVLNLSIQKSITKTLPSSGKDASRLLVIGFIASLTFVQSSVFFTSKSAQNSQILGVVRDWVKSNLLTERDGGLLRWTLSTPLTSVKLIFSCWLLLLATTIAQKITQKDHRKLHAFLFINLLLSMLLGVSHETLTAIGLILITISLDLRKKRDVLKNFSLLLTLLFVIGTYLFATGSQSRQKNLFNSNLQDYILIFLGVVWQFIWMTSIIVLISILIHKVYALRLLPDERLFSNSITVTMRYLFAVSLITQITLETFIYPAAYHWISYCLITFFYCFLQLESNRANSKKQNKSGQFPLLVFMICSSILILSLASTVMSAQERYRDISHREEISKGRSENMTTNIPLIDNSGVLYAEDLAADFGSIVPFKGFTLGSNMFCYKRLEFN